MQFRIRVRATYFLVLILSTFIIVFPEITSTRATRPTTTKSGEDFFVTLPPGLTAKVSCGPPPAIENGQIEDKKENVYGAFRIGVDYPIGTSVWYSCAKGYKLIGEPRSRCSFSIRGYISNRWSKPPQCMKERTGFDDLPKHTSTTPPYIPTHLPTLPDLTRRPCSQPPTSPFNRIRDWRWEYASFSTVYYECQYGYRMIGSPVLTCTKRGTWDPSEPPFCVSITEATTTRPVYSKTESPTIMKIIMYISIPLLVLFAVALMCNIRRRHVKANRRFRERNNETRQIRLLPTAPGLYIEDEAAYPRQQFIAPTAPLMPSSHILLHIHEFSTPIAPPMDASTRPAAVIQQPPSYEEATRDSGPPSFEAAQRLGNSNSRLRP